MRRVGLDVWGSLAAAGLSLLVCSAARADAEPSRGAIDAYFRPFAATNNLSGAVLIKRGDAVLFAKSYGFAQRDKRTLNRLDTRFHIASISILFTSTAVLRLIDQGKLSFDTQVSEIVSGIPNGDRITIRELLEQNSGLPDANDLPNYDELLKRHQTPETLIGQIRGLPPFSEPGGKSQHEEHSGQNLLALIIERKTGLPFAQAMQAEVFGPFGMRNSGIDDDGPIGGPVARGYRPAGSFGLKPAPAIHWSGKSGNGSAYSTVNDVWKWLQGLRRGDLLSESSRKAMLETSAGYGWEHRQSTRLGEPVYLVGGRSPGFSCFMEYLPDEDIAIIALTNLENAANPTIVPYAAALLRGRPYEAFRYDHRISVPSRVAGEYRFGPDFFRPSGALKLTTDAGGATLNWPGGPAAALLPIGKDRFMDRYYWIEATVVRGADGNPVELDYGQFKGLLTSAPAPD